MTRVLVTGAAGFIGFHVARRLLERGDSVVGADNLSDYYSVQLKRDRLALLEKHPQFRFEQLDLADRAATAALFRVPFDRVVHLAAQAGVRYSIENPHAYIDSNLVGHANVLEGCRQRGVQHLVYASSSSVYGLNTRMPFSVHDRVDHPISLYAATKKANELMTHAYSHLHGLPATGLRFFTVYGPWGRPDMAIFTFTRAILEGRPIQIYNQGRMWRDFTYIDDVVAGVMLVLDRIATPDPGWSSDAPDASSSQAPHRLYNIGNHRPVELLCLVEVLERALGAEASKVFVDAQPGDVMATYADVDDLARDVGFAPNTELEEGIAQFVQWYREYYDMPASGR